MRRHIRGSVRLKHLNASGRWPSGNTRYYYRPKGQKGIPLPDLRPEEPAFLEAYLAASNGEPPKPDRAVTGTIAAGITAYLGSDTYQGLATSTRGVWRRYLDDIRERYGQGTMETLQAKHIRQDLAMFAAHPANNRLKVWRSLCKWWLDAGLVEDNPAKHVEKRRTPPAKGAAPWSRADMQTFRDHWPIGTQERLAFELMYQTCSAIGDMTRLSPNMVKNGWLTYTRQKSKSTAVCPWTAPAPTWFEPSEFLHDCIAAAPRGLTFLLTAHNRPRGAKGAASWFSRVCTMAGLPDHSAHGIRKGRAAIFKENGATADQRMAILGHETEEEAQNYSKSADLMRIVTGTEKFQLLEQVPTPPEKRKQIK